MLLMLILFTCLCAFFQLSMSSDKLESPPGGSWKSSPPCSLSGSQEKSPISLSNPESGEMLPYSVPLPYSCAQGHTRLRQDCRKLRPATISDEQDGCHLLSAPVVHREEHWSSTGSSKFPLNSHTLCTKPSLHNGNPTASSYGNSYAGKNKSRTRCTGCLNIWTAWHSSEHFVQLLTN